MKAIKLILVVLTVVLTVSVNAQDAWFNNMPTMNMGSTSGMMVSGSDLPSAALGGVSMATMPEASMGETPLAPQASRGPRRGLDPGDIEDKDTENWADPMDDPIGPMPWALMALLCGGYAAAAAYRRREE